MSLQYEKKQNKRESESKKRWNQSTTLKDGGWLMKMKAKTSTTFKHWTNHDGGSHAATQCFRSKTIGKMIEL